MPISSASVACICCCSVVAVTLEVRLEIVPVPVFLFAVGVGTATVIVSDGLPPSLILSALMSLLELCKLKESTTRPKDILVGDRSSLVEVDVIKSCFLVQKNGIL